MFWLLNSCFYYTHKENWSPKSCKIFFFEVNNEASSKQNSECFFLSNFIQFIFDWSATVKIIMEIISLISYLI